MLNFQHENLIKSFESEKEDNHKCTTSDCVPSSQLMEHVLFFDTMCHDIFIATILAVATFIDSALILFADLYY
jgi:translation initiation factor 2 gamma subunit (eIF-2gamma)